MSRCEATDRDPYGGAPVRCDNTDDGHRGSHRHVFADGTSHYWTATTKTALDALIEKATSADKMILASNRQTILYDDDHREVVADFGIDYTDEAGEADAKLFLLARRNIEPAIALLGRLVAWEMDPDRAGSDAADLAHEARALLARLEEEAGR